MPHLYRKYFNKRPSQISAAALLGIYKLTPRTFVMALHIKRCQNLINCLRNTDLDQLKSSKDLMKGNSQNRAHITVQGVQNIIYITLRIPSARFT